jgi:hypothetical protein
VIDRSGRLILAKSEGREHRLFHNNACAVQCFRHDMTQQWNRHSIAEQLAKLSL